MLGWSLNKPFYAKRLSPRLLQPVQAALLDFGTTTLNEKQQHDYERHAGNDSNDGNVVHVRASFLLVKRLVERLHHDDGSWSQNHHEQ